MWHDADVGVSEKHIPFAPAVALRSCRGFCHPACAEESAIQARAEVGGHREVPRGPREGALFNDGIGTPDPNPKLCMI